MNKKGQALVELIIILPIMIFVLLAIVDFGIMSYNKNRLENMIDDVSKMYKNNETTEEINKFIKDNDKDITYQINNKEKYITIKLSKKYKTITPGVDKMFKISNIDVEREIYNE